MSKSSSIFTAFPKMNINCITLANSHMFRIFSMSGMSPEGSQASMSLRERLRPEGPMARHGMGLAGGAESGSGALRLSVRAMTERSQGNSSNV